MNLDIDDFAVGGERGVDLFRRQQDQASRRARFVCIATVIDAPADAAPGWPPAQPAPPEQAAAARGRGMICHQPAASAQAAGLWQAVARLEAQPALHRPFSLADAPAYPGTDGMRATHELFLYTEFFRERQLAAHGLDLLARALHDDPDAAARMDPGELTTLLRQALDYNMIARGAALWPALEPLLRARAALRGLPKALNNATGYALRLLGDLRLRAGAGTQALGAFEAALALGDNPFRRRRAIEAALAAGQPEAANRHAAAHRASHGKLPADLQTLLRAAGLTQEVPADPNAPSPNAPEAAPTAQPGPRTP